MWCRNIWRTAQSRGFRHAAGMAESRVRDNRGSADERATGSAWRAWRSAHALPARPRAFGSQRCNICCARSAALRISPRRLSFLCAAPRNTAANSFCFPSISRCNCSASCATRVRLERYAAWRNSLPEYEELFTRLAKENGLYIIGGTHPVIQSGRIVQRGPSVYAERPGVSAEKGPSDRRRKKAPTR